MGAGIHLGQRTQLRVRAEHQVDARAGPLERARPAIAPFEGILRIARGLPLRAHVEQVHEEVVREAAWPPREDALLRTTGVGAEHAQAADQHRHLGRGQREQLRAVDEQVLGGHRERARLPVAEAIGERLERRERGHVGVFLGGIHATGREGHGHIEPGLLCCLRGKRSRPLLESIQGGKNLTKSRAAQRWMFIDLLVREVRILLPKLTGNF